MIFKSNNSTIALIAMYADNDNNNNYNNDNFNINNN